MVVTQKAEEKFCGKHSQPLRSAKAARAGWRIHEVSISYSERTYEAGRKIGWRDALKALCAIIYF
jgi:hypothetical protein